MNVSEDESAGLQQHTKHLAMIKRNKGESHPLHVWWDYGRGHMLCAADLVHESLAIQKAHGWIYPLPEGSGRQSSNCCQAAAVSRYSYIHIRLPPHWSSPPSNGLCMSQYTMWLKVIQKNFSVEGLGGGSVKNVTWFLIWSLWHSKCRLYSVCHRCYVISE